MGECENCKFWRSYDPEFDMEIYGAGECRRYPPQVTAYLQAYWPITRSYDQCGEWVEKHVGRLAR